MSEFPGSRGGCSLEAKPCIVFSGAAWEQADSSAAPTRTARHPNPNPNPNPRDAARRAPTLARTLTPTLCLPQAGRELDAAPIALARFLPAEGGREEG